MAWMQDKRWGSWRILLLLAGVAAWPTIASGQIVGSDATANSQASWNTAQQATVAQRRPGRVVAGGRSRYVERQNDTLRRIRGGPTITEQPDTGPTLGQQVKMDLINEFFEFLNDLFFNLVTGQTTTSDDLTTDTTTNGESTDTPITVVETLE